MIPVHNRKYASLGVVSTRTDNESRYCIAYLLSAKNANKWYLEYVQSCYPYHQLLKIENIIKLVWF